MTPEGKISSKIMGWLRSVPKMVAWKISDLNNVGFPDIAGVYEGKAFFFEVKSKDGRATRKQIYEMNRIINAGGRAAIVRSLETAQLIFINWFGLDPIFCESIGPKKSNKGESHG